MIITNKMWEEYRVEYEKEAIVIYENLEDAVKDFRGRTGDTRRSLEQIETLILDDTNCDWKAMPDGRVFCSYIKAEAYASAIYISASFLICRWISLLSSEKSESITIDDSMSYTSTMSRPTASMSLSLWPWSPLVWYACFAARYAS